MGKKLYYLLFLIIFSNYLMGQISEENLNKIKENKDKIEIIKDDFIGDIYQVKDEYYFLNNMKGLLTIGSFFNSKSIKTELSWFSDNSIFLLNARVNLINLSINNDNINQTKTFKENMDDYAKYLKETFEIVPKDIFIKPYFIIEGEKKILRFKIIQHSFVEPFVFNKLLIKGNSIIEIPINKSEIKNIKDFSISIFGNKGDLLNIPVYKNTADIFLTDEIINKIKENYLSEEIKIRLQSDDSKIDTILESNKKDAFILIMLKYFEEI